MGKQKHFGRLNTRASHRNVNINYYERIKQTKKKNEENKVDEFIF